MRDDRAMHRITVRDRQVRLPLLPLDSDDLRPRVHPDAVAQVLQRIGRVPGLPVTSALSGELLVIVQATLSVAPMLENRPAEERRTRHVHARVVGGPHTIGSCRSTAGGGRPIGSARPKPTSRERTADMFDPYGLLAASGSAARRAVRWRRPWYSGQQISRMDPRR